MRNVPALALAILTAAACGEAAPTDSQPMDDELSAIGRTGQIVELTTRGHTIVAPDEIESGWTTFRLRNESSREHFVVIERMPEGRTVSDSRAEVVPVFQDALDLVNAGDPDAGFAEFARLPAWYFDVVFFGGPGLLSPGHTGETTLYLEPGTYVLECYVKTNGRFHSSDGMITQVVVRDDAGTGREPRGTLHATVSSSGIELDGALRPGRHTIEVSFAEQMLHEHFLGTDVHLVRLDDGTDLAALGDWMNWIVGLDTPAPAEFLGGTHEMPTGETAYVSALLTPGRYALIAEVPDPAAKGMLVEFTVPEHRRR